VRRSNKVGPKTVNNEVLVLIAVLRSARLWRPLEETYRPLKVPKRGPGRALTPEQIQRLIQAARQNDRWHVALCATILAYSTGCRMGEIKQLQLRDLNLETERPFLRLRAETTKKRYEREAALNELGLWAVNQLLVRAKILAVTKPDHYLLPKCLSNHTKESDPLQGRKGFDPNHHQESWTSAWESVRKAAGLDGLRFHDLRHSFITHAIEEGVPIEVVMAQVGHISPEMTRYYTHVGSQVKHSAVAAVQRRSSVTLEQLGGTPR
jgi:integrase